MNRLPVRRSINSSLHGILLCLNDENESTINARVVVVIGHWRCSLSKEVGRWDGSPPLGPNLDEGNLVLNTETQSLHSTQTSQRLGNLVQNVLFFGSHDTILYRGGMQVVKKIGLVRVSSWGCRCRRLDGGSLRNADTNAMRGLRAQVPEESKIRSGNWSSDIGRSVAKAKRKDLCFARDAEQTGTGGEDATAVGGSTLGKDDDNTIRSFASEIREGDQIGILGNRRHRRQEGLQHGLE